VDGDPLFSFSCFAFSPRRLAFFGHHHHHHYQDCLYPFMFLEESCCFVDVVIMWAMRFSLIMTCSAAASKDVGTLLVWVMVVKNLAMTRMAPPNTYERVTTPAKVETVMAVRNGNGSLRVVSPSTTSGVVSTKGLSTTCSSLE